MINIKSILDVRRDLHKIPELAFHEYNTKEYIKTFVKNNANDFKLIDESKGGLIYRKYGRGHSLLWRSEMDALPLEDKKNVSYSSKNKGICHACGHDAHMAILLSTMSSLQGKDTCNIYCVFQCAEESFGGAHEIVSRMNCLNIHVNEAYAIHVDPMLPAGIVSSKSGIILSSNDTYIVSINIKGGHISQGNSHIKVIETIIEFINKHQNKDMQIRLSNVKDNGYFNISPSQIIFSISIRRITEKNKNVIYNLISILENINGIFKINLKKFPHYPSVINDDYLNTKLSKAIYNTNIKKINSYVSFSSDDFSMYSSISDHILYMFIGCKIPGKNYLCHTESFNINESCLEIGKTICENVLIKSF